MISNVRKLENFERELIVKEKLSHAQAMRIYDALHKEAVALGVIHSGNMLEGIETTIRVAKIVNGLR